MVGKASRAGGARRRSGKKTRSRFSIAKGMPPPVETPKSRAAARREGGARSARGAAGGARGTGSRARGRADRSTDVPETPRTRPTRACEAPREARLRVGWTRVRFSASVKRRGAWAAVFGAGTRARCEFGQRPRSVSSRVAATGATRRRYRGRDRGNTDLRGSRGRRPRCSPCPFGSSRAVALRRTGVATVSHERAGENIKPCDTIAWWRALEGKREG